MGFPAQAALAFALLLALSLSSPTLSEPMTAADVWSARLTGLNASYGPEDWKYAGLPGGTSVQAITSHIENETSSFQGAVGLRASLDIEIYNIQDRSAAAVQDYSVQAKINTPRGPIQGYVFRATGDDPNRFRVDFDLDGANNADPAGNVPPPADPGLQQVELTILKAVRDNPPQKKVGEARMEFTYEQPVQTARIDRLEGRSYQQFVPDSMFRLFTDVGWDRSVLMVTRPVVGSDAIELEYEFDPSIAGQAVELRRLVAERAVKPNPSAPTAPAPLPSIPFIPGVSDNETLRKATEGTDRFVTVDNALVTGGESVVDANGNVRFVVGAQSLLVHGNDLVVLAAVLKSNFDPDRCDEDCLGSPAFRVGATELVAPVSSQHVNITRYKLLDEQSRGGAAPAPVRDVALAANALQVYVRDEDGFSSPNPQNPQTRSGDVYAVVAGGRSSAPLSGAGLSPSQSEGDVLSGNLPVRNIQEAGVNIYRVFAFVYQSQDQFYGLAFGDRGYRLRLDPLEVQPGDDSGVWVNVTSVTTNYDEVPEDPGFDLKVTLTVKVGDGANVTKSVAVKELSETATFFAVPAAEVDVPVSVESTSGDLLPPAATTIIRFTPEDSGVDKPRIPGFDAVALVGAVVAMIAWARRRR